MFGIDDAISAVSNLASTIVTRAWPDATEIEKAKLLQVTQELQNEYNLILGQIDINKIEAASTNWLVAGPRPFILWVCGVAFLYSALLEPFLRFIFVVFYKYGGSFPLIDTNLTMQVMMGLLGLGAFRTIEKIKNVERNR